MNPQVKLHYRDDCLIYEFQKLETESLLCFAAVFIDWFYLSSFGYNVTLSGTTL